MLREKFDGRVADLVRALWFLGCPCPYGDAIFDSSGQNAESEKNDICGKCPIAVVKPCLALSRVPSWGAMTAENLFTILFFYFMHCFFLPFIIFIPFSFCCLMGRSDVGKGFELVTASVFRVFGLLFFLV